MLVAKRGEGEEKRREEKEKQVQAKNKMLRSTGKKQKIFPPQAHNQDSLLLHPLPL